MLRQRAMRYSFFNFYRLFAVSCIFHLSEVAKMSAGILGPYGNVFGPFQSAPAMSYTENLLNSIPRNGVLDTFHHGQISHRNVPGSKHIKVECMEERSKDETPCKMQGKLDNAITKNCHQTREIKSDEIHAHQSTRDRETKPSMLKKLSALFINNHDHDLYKEKGGNIKLLKPSFQPVKPKISTGNAFLMNLSAGLAMNHVNSALETAPSFTNENIEFKCPSALKENVKANDVLRMTETQHTTLNDRKHINKSFHKDLVDSQFQRHLVGEKHKIFPDESLVLQNILANANKIETAVVGELNKMNSLRSFGAGIATDITSYRKTAPVIETGGCQHPTQTHSSESVSTTCTQLSPTVIKDSSSSSESEESLEKDAEVYTGYGKHPAGTVTNGDATLRIEEEPGNHEDLQTEGRHQRKTYRDPVSVVRDDFPKTGQHITKQMQPNKYFESATDERFSRGNVVADLNHSGKGTLGATDDVEFEKSSPYENEVIDKHQMLEDVETPNYFALESKEIFSDEKDQTSEKLFTESHKTQKPQDGIRQSRINPILDIKEDPRMPYDRTVTVNHENETKLPESDTTDPKSRENKHPFLTKANNSKTDKTISASVPKKDKGIPKKISFKNRAMENPVLSDPIDDQPRITKTGDYQGSYPNIITGRNTLIPDKNYLLRKNANKHPIPKNGKVKPTQTGVAQQSSKDKQSVEIPNFNTDKERAEKESGLTTSSWIHHWEEPTPASRHRNFPVTADSHIQDADNHGYFQWNEIDDTVIVTTPASEMTSLDMPTSSGQPKNNKFLPPLKEARLKKLIKKIMAPHTDVHRTPHHDHGSQHGIGNNKVELLKRIVEVLGIPGLKIVNTDSGKCLCDGKDEPI